MFTATMSFCMYMKKTNEMEVKYIELANRFIWAFPLDVMEKLKRIFWTT